MISNLKTLWAHRTVASANHGEPKSGAGVASDNIWLKLPMMITLKGLHIGAYALADSFDRAGNTSDRVEQSNFGQKGNQESCDSK